jgi:hypothetical protein
MGWSSEDGPASSGDSQASPPCVDSAAALPDEDALLSQLEASSLVRGPLAVPCPVSYVQRSILCQPALELYIMHVQLQRAEAAAQHSTARPPDTACSRRFGHVQRAKERGAPEEVVDMNRGLG